MSRASTAATCLALALAASGCSIGYLVRAGISEARILWRREPIEAVLARPGLDPALRERLQLVLDVRQFAAAPLGLRVGDSYTTYSDVEGEHIWVVSAARRDRLESHTWWYPIVGSVPYKGFFERARADGEGRALEARGLDVDIRTASAFSTLGWFADPLLSTTVRADPVTLAETVVHELFHATLYLPGEATFNESAAMFVGYRGAQAFFCRPDGTPERCRIVIERWDRMRAHGRILAHLARRLRALYAAAPPPAERERRRRWFAAAAARAVAARHLGDPAEIDPPNNARLLGMLVYETDLDLFDRTAPDDARLPGAIASLVAAARGASDPFAALRKLVAGAPVDAPRSTP